MRVPAKAYTPAFFRFFWRGYLFTGSTRAGLHHRNILIAARLNDPRVQYWEPAKWAAKLRALKTGDNLLLLKTHLGAGHFASNGRYDYLKDIAFEYAFVLNVLD